TNVFTAKMTMAKARGMTLMEQPEAAEAVSTRKTVVSARNHRGNAVLLRRIFRAKRRRLKAKRRRVGADRRRSADSCCSGAAREAYETAGGCGGCYAQQRTAPKPSETARKRSRASTAASEVTGHGVAPFGNNKRPCLKQPEAGWVAISGGCGVEYGWISLF
ncbi:MAG: hypothetical protein LBD24_06320, partial [Spirochaetaceae bacterium]|nr:hypothetical protein [Spirochaetaceae bacterium]